MASTASRKGGLAADGRGTDLLIVSGSHGLPAVRARLERLLELAREFSFWGLPTDVVLLREAELCPFESDLLRRLAVSTQSVEVIEPPVEPPIPRWRKWLRKKAVAEPVLGDSGHCPPVLLRRLEEAYAPRGYRAVICCGVHLASALSLFPTWTDRLLDVPRLGHFSHLTHTRSGYGDEFAAYADWGREKALLQHANALIVRCGLDAVRLRKRVFPRDMILLPPTGWVADPDDEASVATSAADDGRPVVLAVGSATSTNVDGFQWLVKEVFPRLRERVPEVVLRVVGEVGDHIFASDGVERVGRLDSIEAEYERASVVALPLLVGDGIRRRAVEALVRGKVLATTTVGTSGLHLTPGLDAIVTDEPAAMGDQIAEALLHPELRETYQRRALFRAHEGFDPLRTFGMLGRRLGLSRRMLQARAAARALAGLAELSR